MATTDKAIETLVECVSGLLSAVNRLAGGLADGSLVAVELPIIKGICEQANTALNKLASPDHSAGGPEIDLCGRCKQRPCGCRKMAYCKHCNEFKYCSQITHDGKCTRCNGGITEEVVLPSPPPAAAPACGHETFERTNTGVVGIGYVATFVCTQCGHVGRIDKQRGRGIEWWPTSPNEVAVKCLEELKEYLKAYVGEYTNASTMWLDTKLRELKGEKA